MSHVLLIFLLIHSCRLLVKYIQLFRRQALVVEGFQFNSFEEFFFICPLYSKMFLEWRGCLLPCWYWDVCTFMSRFTLFEAVVGKNRGICHSCRKPGHLLLDCPTKKQCPKCGERFKKCMEVEKKTSNKGWLFYCCTRYCGHFKWKKVESKRLVAIRVVIIWVNIQSKICHVCSSILLKSQKRRPRDIR